MGARSHREYDHVCVAPTDLRSGNDSASRYLPFPIGEYMRRVLTFAIAVALIMWVGSDSATTPSRTMRSRLVGSWEGIVEGDFRVFKIEVASRDETSIVAMTAGQANSVTLLFKV